MDLQAKLREKGQEFGSLDMLDPDKPRQMMAMSELYRKMQQAYANLAKELVYHLSRKRGGNHGEGEGSDGQDSGEQSDAPDGNADGAVQ